MAFESLSITGSLLGSASRANSASYVPGSNFNFPFTGSADIIGTLILNNQPVVPTEFANFLPNGTPGLGVPVDIPVTNFASIGSGITGNGTGFTLQAGKTYYLEFQPTQLWGGSAGNNFIFEWVNSSNVAVGTVRTQGYVSSYNTNSNSFSGSMATAIVSPSSSLFVKVRVTSGSGTINGGWGGYVGRIQRIG